MPQLRGNDPILGLNTLAQNRGFHLGIFSTVFWVLKFRGHFQSLNNIFWDLDYHTT
jgi:hypothetical protein